jgi:hypothetical protein
MYFRFTGDVLLLLNIAVTYLFPDFAQPRNNSPCLKQGVIFSIRISPKRTLKLGDYINKHKNK